MTLRHASALPSLVLGSAAALVAGLLATTGLAQPAPAVPPQAAQQPATVGERLGDAVKAVTGDPAADARRDMKRVLSALSDLNGKPIERLSPAEARQQPTPADAVRALLRQEGKPDAPEPGVATRDIGIPGPAGTLQARVYAPEGVQGPMPVVVYFHGGGFVIGTLDSYDAGPRAVAKQARVVVVSVEYRHAPEAKFPAAHDDAVAAYKWVAENAPQLDGDPRRVAVMGESAGGNLAVNTAIAARDRRLPMPVAQILVYPTAGTNLDTPSYRANEDAKPLGKAMMAWFYDNLVRSDADRQDPRLDVVGHANLAGLPPATVITAGIDPLRRDGIDLAEKLMRAGVPVALRDYPHVTHEFFGMGAVVADAADAQAYAVQRFQLAFGPTEAAQGARGAQPLAVAARIEEHMEVLGSDGGHVGTVDYLEGLRIKLTRDDQAAGGRHHLLDLGAVASVEGGKVRLNRTADQARAEWETE